MQQIIDYLISYTIMCSYSLHFRLNLIDFLDQHGDNFDKATHGGLAVLRAAIQIFGHLTKTFK